MSDVIPVLFVECVVGDKLEGLAPEDQTILHGQAKSFEKQGVLEATEVFEMFVLSQIYVKVTHTEGKML